MTLNPLRRASEPPRGPGVGPAVQFLYAQAEIHHGEVGDARRRGALRHAADRLRDGHEAGRPS